MTVVRGEPQIRWADDDVDPMEDVLEQKRQVRLKKAFSLSSSLHMTEDERHDLARMIVGVDRDGGGSWKELSTKQLHDLITMFEGYVYITHLMSERC